MFNNALVLSSVAFADNKMALIVPAMALIPDDTNFAVSAYGVHSTCWSITLQCINMKDTGLDAYLALNSALLTTFNFSHPTTGTTVPFRIPNSSSIVMDLNLCNVDPKCVSVNYLNDTADDIISSPFKFAAVLTSHAYMGAADACKCDVICINPTLSMHIVINKTGFFVHSESGAWNILLCTVDVVSSTYQSWLQGELQNLTGAINNIHDTLGGALVSNSISYFVSTMVNYACSSPIFSWLFVLRLSIQQSTTGLPLG